MKKFCGLLIWLLVPMVMLAQTKMTVDGPNIIKLAEDSTGSSFGLKLTSDKAVDSLVFLVELAVYRYDSLMNRSYIDCAELKQAMAIDTNQTKVSFGEFAKAKDKIKYYVSVAFIKPTETISQLPKNFLKLLVTLTKNQSQLMTKDELHFRCTQVICFQGGTRLECFSTSMNLAIIP